MAWNVTSVSSLVRKSLRQSVNRDTDTVSLVVWNISQFTEQTIPDGHVYYTTWHFMVWNISHWSDNPSASHSARNTNTIRQSCLPYGILCSEMRLVRQSGGKQEHRHNQAIMSTVRHFMVWNAFGQTIMRQIGTPTQSGNHVYRTAFHGLKRVWSDNHETNRNIDTIRQSCLPYGISWSETRLVRQSWDK